MEQETEKWVDGRGSLPADMDGDGEHMLSTELGREQKGEGSLQLLSGSKSLCPI